MNQQESKWHYGNNGKNQDHHYENVMHHRGIGQINWSNYS